MYVCMYVCMYYLSISLMESFEINMYLYIRIILAFLVKIPMFMVHASNPEGAYRITLS